MSAEHWLMFHLIAAGWSSTLNVVGERLITLGWCYSFRMDVTLSISRSIKLNNTL